MAHHDRVSILFPAGGFHLAQPFQHAHERQHGRSLTVMPDKQWLTTQQSRQKDHSNKFSALKRTTDPDTSSIILANQNEWFVFRPSSTQSHSDRTELP